MIKVKSKVNVYEINGEETHGLELPTIEVHSHWNEHDKVVIVVDHKSHTVVAADLEAAIANATRTGR